MVEKVNAGVMTSSPGVKFKAETASTVTADDSLEGAISDFAETDEALGVTGLTANANAAILANTATPITITTAIDATVSTDELHQFKPSVLDEVETTLHYFNEVLFDATPQLYRRFKQALHNSFPYLKPPSYNFCKFGSWVGADRDGNPFCTPVVTWQTACYQRQIVLEKYINAVDRLKELLSLSLHWSDVLPELLDSLDRDHIKMSEVYDCLLYTSPSPRD